MTPEFFSYTSLRLKQDSLLGMHHFIKFIFIYSFVCLFHSFCLNVFSIHFSSDWPDSYTWFIRFHMYTELWLWLLIPYISLTSLLYYSGYQSHVPSNNVFPTLKTMFWWTSIICIHDNNGKQSFQNHYCSVHCRSIRFALPSSPWQKLIRKTNKIVWSAFSFISLMGTVLKLQIYSVQVHVQ